jgi:uric acid-xanthine permease
MGATLVPDWFSYVFTYEGDNRAKAGFFDAIVLVMETGFAVAAFIALALNLILPEEDHDEETESLAGDLADRDEVERQKSEEFDTKGAEGESKGIRGSDSIGEGSNSKA